MIMMIMMIMTKTMVMDYLRESGIPTLSHKIFKVMPLDIVGKVSDVNAAVLLRAITKALHHSVLCGCTFFVTSTRSTGPSAATLVSRS